MFVSSNLLRELLPYFQRKLKAHYTSREIESLFLFACFHQFGLAKSEILAGGKRLTESELLFFRDVVERLGHHEPVQYIVGKTEFYGLMFEVNPSVLIPRPETEELVDIIVRENNKAGKLNILDIGTGSGCIAIALQKNLAGSAVTAIDVSGDALKVAKSNAIKNNSEVIFLEKNVFTDNLRELADIDILVSNPPYIPHSDKETINKNVLDHEPHIALFVENNDPLIFYRRIIELAKTHLKKGGKIYFETHYDHGNEVKQLIKENGFVDVTIRQDISGLDRFVTAAK